MLLQGDRCDEEFQFGATAEVSCGSSTAQRKLPALCRCSGPGFLGVPAQGGSGFPLGLGGPAYVELRS